jgi:hypothetical protein
MSHSVVSGRYLRSADYAADLAATRATWSGHAIPETAGAFVFLTYLTLPALTAVRAATGPRWTARSVLDGQAERLFLLRLIGLTSDPAWGEGFKNARVRRMAGTMADRHLGFPGMRHEYLDLIASLLALAPLRVRDHLGHETGETQRARYWRYITTAMALMHGRLSAEREASQTSECLVGQLSGLATDGAEPIRSFAARHPAYVQMAIPVLFGPSRTLVLSVIGDPGA